LRIKICGITNEADSQQAASLGADAIGLNFYDKSPRFVGPSVAAAIIRQLPPFVEPIPVFVESPAAVLDQLERSQRIRTIQWHGESDDPVEGFPYRLIRAFRVAEPGHLEQIHHYLERRRTAGGLPAALLIDGLATGLYGGTGRTAPWELIAEFRPGVPLILAGGLTPENVCEAIRVVRPYAVDVASGVEARPGRKDREKMLRFISSAREAAAKYNVSE
jgi:phosphoribosylanthranilate isomerase